MNCRLSLSRFEKVIGQLIQSKKYRIPLSQCGQKHQNYKINFMISSFYDVYWMEVSIPITN